MMQPHGIPAGWTARSWALRLRQMAAACAQDHPEHAAMLRRWADEVHIDPPPADPAAEAAELARWRRIRTAGPEPGNATE